MSRTLDALRQSPEDRGSFRRDPPRDPTEDSILASLGYPAVQPSAAAPARRLGLVRLVLGIAVIGLLAVAGWFGAKATGWWPHRTAVPSAPAAGGGGRTPVQPAPEPRPHVVSPAVTPSPASAPADVTPTPGRRPPSAAAGHTAATPAVPASVVPASTPVPVIPSASPAAPRNGASAADHFRRALYYHRTGDFENALMQYRAVLAVDELHVEAHNNIGLLYLDKKLYDDAIRAFRRATVIDETYDKAHNNLGIALLNSGNTDSAAAEFRALVARDSRNIEALTNLGTAVKALGHLDEAREVLQRAIAIQGTYGPAHYNLALIYDESGDLVRAIQHYESFLSSAGPDHVALASEVRARVQQLKAKLI